MHERFVERRRTGIARESSEETRTIFRCVFVQRYIEKFGQEESDILERYGLHLGMAFQLIDDYLDYAGASEATGKALFTDLREGKMTYPLIVAYEREPELRTLLETIIAHTSQDDAEDGAADPVVTAKLQGELMAALDRTGALTACRELALEHADKAAEVLAPLPDSRAKNALLTVAKATVHREA